MKKLANFFLGKQVEVEKKRSDGKIFVYRGKLINISDDGLLIEDEVTGKVFLKWDVVVSICEKGWEGGFHGRR